MSDSNLEKEFDWYARLQKEKIESTTDEVEEELMDKKIFDITRIDELLDILDVKKVLLEVKQENIDLFTENFDLKAKVKKLESQARGQEVELKDSLYYKPNGSIPYCIACYHMQNKLIPVVSKQTAGMTNMEHYYCSVCHEVYPKDGKVPFLPKTT